MAEKRATGITGPAYQLFGPDALEQALVPLQVAQSGKFAPVVGDYALEDARTNAAAMRGAYGTSLADANMKALMNSILEMQNEREINRVKTIGSIAEKDPYGVPAMYDTGGAGLTKSGPGIDQVAALFARIAAGQRLGSTYKDVGEGAQSLTEAGRQSALPDLNAFFRQLGLPGSLDTPIPKVSAAAAGNPTKDTVVQDVPQVGGGSVKTTSVVAGQRTPEQTAATVAGQRAGINRGSGGGRVLSKAEVSAWRSLVPNGTIDPKTYTTPQGVEYVLVRQGDQVWGYRKVGNKTARIRLQ